MIPYGKQSINKADLASVLEVLQSDWLTQGPMVPKFEREVANKVGAEYAIAVNSGTSALHIACLALGLGPRDYLWTSPNTFVASANCALYCGAKIDFVDINPHTYNICPAALKLKLEQAERHGCLPKIVIPVHFSGQACEMDKIKELANRYKFKIIEDASHAFGGRYKDLPIGNSAYSDITIFSFHPVKIITTAEGGMAVTNNEKLAKRMQLLRSHGVTRDPKLMLHNKNEPWYYEQINLGFNYRMTDLQAALGLSQLTRLTDFVEKRHYLASAYNKELQDLPLILPFQHKDTFSSYHLYVIQVNTHRTSLPRNILFKKLQNANIGVNLHYIPVHTQPYYQSLGFLRGNFPRSEHYADHAISLPMYPGLTEEEQKYIINQLKLFLG